MELDERRKTQRTLGVQIFKKRGELGISEDELGKALNLALHRASRLERGVLELNWDLFVSVNKVLKLGFDDLCSGKIKQGSWGKIYQLALHLSTNR